MSKHWKIVGWSDECPECGDGVMVFTDCDDDNWACDGDDAKCVGCGKKGWVAADGDRAWVNWDGE
jgi:hypothetical protein